MTKITFYLHHFILTSLNDYIVSIMLIFLSFILYFLFAFAYIVKSMYHVFLLSLLTGPPPLPRLILKEINNRYYHSRAIPSKGTKKCHPVTWKLPSSQPKAGILNQIAGWTRKRYKISWRATDCWQSAELWIIWFCVLLWNKDIYIKKVYTNPLSTDVLTKLHSTRFTSEGRAFLTCCPNGSIFSLTILKVF